MSVLIQGELLPGEAHASDGRKLPSAVCAFVPGSQSSSPVPCEWVRCSGAFSKYAFQTWQHYHKCPELSIFSITFSYSNVYQQKFVSTTLRSTLLLYPQLYEWEGCASFVADYLSLELLDPPFEIVRESDLTYDGCLCILDTKTRFNLISVLSSPSSCHLPPGFCRLREDHVLISPSCCVACCWARDTTLTASVATLQKRCVFLISHDKSVLYCSLKYK